MTTVDKVTFSVFDQASLRRFVSVLGLLVLAPWVGEYLLGDIPFGTLVAFRFWWPSTAAAVRS